MATTPLERLLFLQGGRCFFCKLPLPKAEASIEHLQALAIGGTNHDDNCVACCKTLNRALGSMPLKAKLEVVLNQKGDFICPNAALRQKAQGSAETKLPAARVKVAPKKPDALQLVTDNLRQRGASRPRSESRLRSTVQTLLGQDKLHDSVEAILDRLRAAGTVSIDKTGKVTYAL